MSGHFSRFQDPNQEHNFLLTYGRVGVFIDVAAALLGLAAVLVKPFRRLSLSAPTPTAANAPEVDSFNDGFKVALCVTTLASFAFLGRQRYTWFRGPLSVFHRLVFALGFTLTARPGLCRYCELLWHHRLLIINSMCVVSRAPSSYYWLGGVVSFIVAVLVDAGEPARSCKQSFSCMFSSLSGLAATSVSNPRLLLKQVFQPSVMAHAAVYLAGVLVPGLVLTFLEFRARKAWLQRRQQQLQVLQDIQQQPSEAEFAEEELMPPAGKRNNEEQRLLQQKGQKTRFQGQEASSSLAAEHNPAATAGAHTLYRSPHLTYVFAVEYDDAADTELSRDVGTSSTARGPAPDSGEEAVLPVDTAEESQATSSARPVVPYSSPVRPHVYSFKFRTPPDAGLQVLEDFKQQLQRRLQAELTARAESYAAAAGLPGPIHPTVTQCTAFPGCYQLVFQVMVPTGQAEVAASPATVNGGSLDVDAEGVAHQVLQHWPYWRLISVQHNVEQPDNELATTASSEAVPSAATPATGPAPALQVLGEPDPGKQALPAVALQPYVMPATTFANSVAVEGGLRAHDSSTDRAAVNLLLHPSLVQQLQRQGYQDVRVVVSKQPSGIVVLDKAFPLQQTQTARATAAEATGSAGAGTTAVEQLYWRAELNLTMHLADETDTPTHYQVLSVVVLACNKQDLAGGSISTAGVTEANGSTQFPALGSHKAAAPAAGCCVLTQLPLLVLPAAVQEEYQTLVAQTQTALAMSLLRTEQELLSVVHDLAAVLTMQVPFHSSCISTTSSTTSSTTTISSENNNYITSVPNALLGAVLDALLAWTGQNNLTEMHSLLQLVKGQYVAAAAEVGAALPGSHSSNEKNVTEHNHQNIKQMVPAAAAITLVTPTPQAAAGSSAGSETSSVAKDDSKHSTSASVAAGPELTKATFSKNSDNSSTFRTSAGPPLGINPVTSTAEAHQLTVLTLLFGFPRAIEAMYAAYKSMYLRRWDCYIMVWHFVAAFIGLCRHAVLALKFVSPEELMACNLRPNMLLINAAPPAILWAASYPGSSLHRLVRWRGVVQISAVCAMLAGCAACFALGGNCRNAAVALGRSHNSSPFIVFFFHTFVQPVVLRANFLTAVAYVCCHLFGFDLMFGRSAFAGLSARATQVISSVTGLGVAVILELSIRRAFVRHLEQNSRA